MSKAQKKSLDSRPEYRKKLSEMLRQNGFKSTKGKICMNNGIKNIYVFPDNISKYEDIGYIKGGKPRKRRGNNGVINTK